MQWAMMSPCTSIAPAVLGPSSMMIGKADHEQKKMKARYLTRDLQFGGTFSYDCPAESATEEHRHVNRGETRQKNSLRASLLGPRHARRASGIDT